VASTRKASISAELRADRAKFKQDLDAAKKDVKAFGDEARKAGGSFNPGAGLGRLRHNFTEINSRATAARNVVEELYGAAMKPALANVWYADLKDSLTAVMGSADAARAHIGQLRLVSDDMSLSDDQFEKLVEYSVRLQSLGHSAEFAAEFVREMANAGEGMGRGVEDMEASLLALDAVEQRGEASMKTLMALSKQVPAFRKVLEAGFGVSAAEDLEKLKLSAAELTEGILLGMKALATARPGDAEEAVSVELRKKQTLGADAEDNNGQLADRVPLTEDDARAQRDKLRARIDARNAADAAAAAAREQAEKDAEADAAETKMIQESVARDNEEKARLAEENAGKRAFAVDAAAAAEVARLRSRGKNKKADKLQADIDEKRRVNELMEEGGLTEPAAQAMAADERGIAEDQAYLDRTGRKKVRGGRYRQGGGGIPNKPYSRLDQEWNFSELEKAQAYMNSEAPRQKDRRSRAEIGVTPDKFSGMTQQQADELIGLQREMLESLRGSQKTVAEKTRAK